MQRMTRRAHALRSAKQNQELVRPEDSSVGDPPWEFKRPELQSSAEFSGCHIGDLANICLIRASPHHVMRRIFYFVHDGQSLISHPPGPCFALVNIDH